MQRNRDKLNMAAAPGPSGWRNSYLAPLLARERGRQALPKWIQIWQRGRLPEQAVRPWTLATLIPLNKKPV